MAAAGGIIGRIRRGGDGEPLFISEYLTDVDGDCWTNKDAEALHFERYEQADELARKLHCFALVRKPPTHALAKQRELEAERSIEPDPPVAVNGQAILAQEAIRARKKRKPRRDRIQLLKALAENQPEPPTKKFWWREEQYA